MSGTLVRKALVQATAATALVGVTVTIGLVLAANARVAPARYTRPSPPAAVGAFKDGGVPEHDPQIEAALGALPGLVPRPDAVEFASRPGLASAWHGLALALATTPQLDPMASPYEGRLGELRARAAAVSDQLAGGRLGYYLDVKAVEDDGVVHPALHGYRIDDVTFVRAADERVRVLGVRRLDHARTTRLGETSDELDDPIVRLDDVDAKVRDQLVPVLQGEPFPLGDASFAYTARGQQLAASASAAIRRELRFALAPAALADPVPRTAALVAASVRHHEAQHAFDRMHPTRQPAPLVTALGGSTDRDLALRARLELSAYLSQIAADTWLPQVVLWSLARHAFRQHERPLAESYVAVVAIEALAAHVGVPPGRPVITAGEIDRDRLATLVTALAAVPTLELRTAAAAAWTDLYGVKLARIVDE